MTWKLCLLFAVSIAGLPVCFFSAVCDGLSAALPGCPCALQIAGLPITVSYPSVPLGTALAAVSGAGAYKHTRRPGQPLKIL